MDDNIKTLFQKAIDEGLQNKFIKKQKRMTKKRKYNANYKKKRRCLKGTSFINQKNDQEYKGT